MPGQLAVRYLALGATDVRYVGKPHPLIYETCVRRVPGGAAGGARLIGVGDSLHHDVLGAGAAGIASLFVCSGVHYKDLGVMQASAEPPDAGKLAKLLDGFAADHDGCRPTHSIAAFRL